MMYIELDRADARGRQELAAELRAVLADVRAAVRDWPKLQAKMREDAAAIDDPEGAALLDWFADGTMTLLGYEVERPDEAPSKTLGIFSIPGAPTDEGGCLGAMRYFEKGGDVPLLAKAERKSTVHRRVPLDLVVVPIREKRQGHRHRSPCRPVDQRGADASARGSPDPARAPRAARPAISASIPKAIRARRCATRSPRCRATCWSISASMRCATW